MNLYKRFKAWWRMRQYIKELKTNNPSHWGYHKKEYDKPRSEIDSINSLISGVVKNNKNTTKV